MSWMSTYVDVEISPETTTSPVFTRVSHATRPVGSSRRTASRTPSEIWSATLSGWPSVTDSEVKRCSLSAYWLMRTTERSDLTGFRGFPLAALAAPLAPLVEVDDERDAVEGEPGAQAVLDEVRVVARHAGAAVDRDREARRADADLRDVEQPEAVALLRRRLARLHRLGQEAVELGCRDARADLVPERQRLGQD